MKLLLAEDDAMLGAGMENALRLAGFTIDWVRHASAADTAIRATRYDLLLLDIGLPGLDGLQLLRRLRADGIDLPVLLVTARDSVSDRVQGLNLGADDYLTKPFDLDELIARIHALGRRRQGRARPDLRLGALVVDPIRHEARLEGELLPLAPREFSLLQALMERPGAVLSKEQLENRLYNWQDEVSSNAVEVHLHHLRRKLGGRWIRNVRGVGYKIEADDAGA